MDFLFDPSLVFYLPLYQLDGASFMSKDASGQVCTVTGAVWTPQGRSLDGTDDVITGDRNTGISGNAEFSLEVWFKAISLTNWDTLLSVGAISLLAGCAIVVMANGDAGLSFGGGNNAHASGIISTDTWYHLVATKVAGAINTTSKVYLDGGPQTLSGASTETPDITNSTPKVGGLPGFGFADAIIDEARIYNRALTPLEIQHNYLATKRRYQ